MPNVEFSLLIEKRLLNVFLKYICSQWSIAVFFLRFESDFDLIQGGTDSNASSSVSNLPWLYDPNIFNVSRLIFHSFVIDQIVSLKKLSKFWILQSATDVKCKRYIIKRILLDQLVIFPHGIKQGFLVANVKVTLEMIVSFLLCSCVRINKSKTFFLDHRLDAFL